MMSLMENLSYKMFKVDGTEVWRLVVWNAKRDFFEDIMEGYDPKKLLKIVHRRWPGIPEGEITDEADPEHAALRSGMNMMNPYGGMGVWALLWELFLCCFKLGHWSDRCDDQVRRRPA